MSKDIHRKFPKILADELSTALDTAKDLMGANVDEYLKLYRKARVELIAQKGITILEKDVIEQKMALNTNIPYEFLTALNNLEQAFERLHRFNDGGAHEYVSEAIKKEVFRQSGGRGKGAISEATKYLVNLMSRLPNTNYKILYKVACEDAIAGNSGSPFSYDHVGGGILMDEHGEITLENFKHRLSKIKSRHLR